MAINIPHSFLEQMQKLLGDEAKSLEDELLQSPKIGLRINLSKTESQSVINLLPFTFTPIEWCPSGYLIDPDSINITNSPGKHPYHAAGLYYLQEPSAMAVVEILNPKSGEHILDLCAAPGGKTTHLATLMQNQGLLIANEIHKQRARELADNVERWGSRNIVITNDTPEQLAIHFGEYFDRVLVDAPCSGEGMFRKSMSARRDWSPEYVQGCSIRQSDILNNAVRLLRPGGWLVYSTCTFNPLENEQVIARFINENNETFEIIQPKSYPGFDRGQPEWVNASICHLEKSVRIWPHRSIGEGQYIALMRKKGEAIFRSLPLQKSNLSREIFIIFHEFCQNTFKSKITDYFEDQQDRLYLRNNQLFMIPEKTPILSGIHTFVPGWYIGTCHKRRFEPSHAMALAISVKDAKSVLNFPFYSQIIEQYLNGESFVSPGESGWVLVCVDGFPLGWGKRVGSQVKNFYPHRLRRSGR
jgi:NOL1/NOP2/sun family putative RNA methylase